ncbi:MAG: biotin/lipoyl-containing protein, partial [Pseudomonadota bacterium]
MTTEFRIPDLGGATDVEVIEVSVAAGDPVEPEQTLLVLETDKASMEIPAEARGTVAQLKVAVGDKVNEGDVFIVLEASAQAPSETTTAEQSAPADSGSDADTTDTTETSRTESDATGTASKDIQQAIPVPDLGGSEGVEVIEVAVSSGDQIDAEQTVLVLESDKATMEIPSGVAGTVVSVAVQVGDKVSQGDAMLSLLVSAGETASQRPVSASPAEPAIDSASTATPTSTQAPVATPVATA